MLKYINYTENSWAQAITLALDDLLGLVAQGITK